MVEVKPTTDDAWLTADSAQVSKYWELYRLVLVTNTRDFVLLGEDANGNPAKLESFRLAVSAADFDKKLQTPKAFANAIGPALAEYLGRALSHRAVLAEPRDLARLLASYARDGLARVEAHGNAPSLNAVRSALEEALGVKFEGEKGAAFFRSTLVQTPLLRHLLGMGVVGPADSREQKGRSTGTNQPSFCVCPSSGSCSGSYPTPDSSSRWD